MTIVQQLIDAENDLKLRRQTVQGEAAREFSLAITAIEDAIMRTNRGFAVLGGRESTADVEGILTEAGEL